VVYLQDNFRIGFYKGRCDEKGTTKPPVSTAVTKINADTQGATRNIFSDALDTKDPDFSRS
jgi:hypothetical protein